MKNDLMVCFLAVMVLFGMGGINILGRIHAFEPVRAGEELELLVNVKNPTDRYLRDMSVKAVFFELGEYVASSEFEIERFDKDGVHLNFDVPKNARAGEHLVKIIASNDDYYDSQYMYVNII